jgi:hypothetical protein
VSHESRVDRSSGYLEEVNPIRDQSGRAYSGCSLNLSAFLQTDAGTTIAPHLPQEQSMEDPTIFLNRIGKFVLIPIGLLLFVAAAWSVWSTKSWLAHTLEVEGVVVELVRMRDSEDKGYVFSPIVRFETADGETHEFQSGLRTYPPAYRTGEVVSVVYDPAVPDAAMIRSLLSLWLMPIILSFIGTIFCAIGIFIIVMCSSASRIFDRPIAGVSRSAPDASATLGGITQ